MKTASKKDCIEHSEQSKQQLKASGLKVTIARLDLLDIFKHAKKPLSIKEIAAQFKSENVDPVTLYRNAEALEKLGLIRQIRLEDRQSYYELAADHHHHIICEKCGKIKDIKNCSVDLPKAAIKNSGFAKVNHHSLEFFGICNSCAKK